MIDDKILKKISKYKYIAGADESGAGCMAGDLVVAAVILDENKPIAGLNDSKALSKNKRDILFDEIVEKAIEYEIVFIPPDTIDKLNILQARMVGFRKAINSLQKVEYSLIDGNKIPKNLKVESDFIIRGDSKVKEIAAASILAKVSRDRKIIAQSKEYPEYGFENHKGYVTKAHKEALIKFGICELHRKSYKPVKDILNK